MDDKLVVISNITVEAFLKPAIVSVFGKAAIPLEVISISYEEYRQKECENLLRQASVIVLWLNLECLISDIWYCGETSGEKTRLEDVQATFKSSIQYVHKYSNACIIGILFEDYGARFPLVLGSIYDTFVDELNHKLVSELSDRVIFLDLKRIIATVGIKKSYSVKNKHRWNYPYTEELTDAIAKEIQKQYFIEHGITKKCLVLDCDNVLWGGILSEDGMENIRLGSSGFGREYQDFQRFVLSLYHRGIMLAVCSKNDLEDVLRVFREHDEMILKEEYIACFQVNWESKPDNIRRIAELLNIGTDSMVFVDDSVTEIEAIKSMLPEVDSILYHREQMYPKFSCFCLKKYNMGADIVKRNETYRTNSLREKLKVQFNRYEDYLGALDVIRRIIVPTYGRFTAD